MNQELRELILAVETKHATLGRSNIGGWHSRPDFLNSSEAPVGALTAWITWGVKHMVDASAGTGVFNGTISLSAWATIRTTMNVYGGALDDTMREYNGKVVRMALRAS